MRAPFVLLAVLVAAPVSAPVSAMSLQTAPLNADGTSRLADPDRAAEAMTPRNPYDGSARRWSSGDSRTFDSRSDPSHVDRSAPRDSSPLLWLYGK